MTLSRLRDLGTQPPGARLVVVGAGGNIGSHLVPHLGRMSGVAEIVLIDPGKYEPSNVATQDIASREVGHRKVAVQARRLRGINPALAVRPLSQRVEDVPLGCLRGDVLLACLDSRAARQYVNQAAWQLGMTWIDAGVHADGLLVQISVYAPGPDTPCLECAWDERDYSALEQTYPCTVVADQPPVTNAPSSLGALAAALQALECRKFLSGDPDRVAFGHQVLIDASGHKHYVTAFGRNLECRMPEHQPWDIRPFHHRFEDATVAQVLALDRSIQNTNGPLTLSVAGRRFVTRLLCPDCGSSRSQLRLESERVITRDRCPACRTAMVTAGFDRRDRLDLHKVSETAGSRSLRSLGLRRGDVLTIGRGVERLHFVVDGSPPVKKDRSKRAGSRTP